MVLLFGLRTGNRATMRKAITTTDSINDQGCSNQPMLKAIEHEAEMYHCYMELAHQVADRHAQRILQTMAEQEIGLFDMLMRYRSNPLVANVFGILIQDLIPNNDDLPFPARISPRDALALAIRKSQQAGHCYLRISEICAAAAIKDCFADSAWIKMNQADTLDVILNRAESGRRRTTRGEPDSPPAACKVAG